MAAAFYECFKARWPVEIEQLPLMISLVDSREYQAAPDHRFVSQVPITATGRLRDLERIGDEVWARTPIVIENRHLVEVEDEGRAGFP